MKTIGLDIGTTTISAVVYDPQEGAVMAKNVKNDSFLPGQPWERLQNPKMIWKKCDALLRELLEAFPEAAAIGVTGQMHGIVYLDASGEPVSPLYIWQDGRGDLSYDENTSWAGHLSQVTGYALASGYGMVTHYYNLKNGLVPESAATFCTIPDYIAMKLAGRTAPAVEATNAASMGLFDAVNGCFDAAALEKAEIPTDLLPKMMAEPYLGTGSLGIPVYAAIGDNQASFLGATGGRTDVLLVNVGTGSQVSVYTPNHMLTPTLETRPFPDGGWLLVGASLCGGRSYALLETFFRQTVKMVTGTEQSAYAAMDRALEEAGPIVGFPTTCTTFQGTRQGPTLRGSITGIGTDNFTPAHLIRSFMEGMARELHDMYRGYLDLGGKAPGTIIGSGNGLRQNRHLQRVFEEVFSCKLILSDNDEEAACGAALYAAKHCS